MKIYLLIISLLTGSFLFGQSPSEIAQLLMNKKITNLDSLSENADVMAIMESLLKYQGDKEINESYSYCTSPEKQSHYIRTQSVRHPTSPSMTNQFIALYLVNALFYENFEFIDQILISFERKKSTAYFTNSKQKTRVADYDNPRWRKPRRTSSAKEYYYLKIRSYKNRLANKLFDLHNDWFNQVKEMGLDKARETDFFPLKESIYSWDRSSMGFR